VKTTRDRVAIYVRASTIEQNLAGQRRAMLDVARTRGWKVARVYAEAKSTRVHRPELERMHAAALRHQHDAVIVWRLDRLGRGLIEVVSRVEELHERGIQVVSVHDGAIDTASAAGKFQLATLAAAAEYERELIRERTREGLARARAAGKTLGRPRRETAALSSAAAWHIYIRPDIPLRECARRFGVPRTSLLRYLERRSKKGTRKSGPRSLAANGAHLVDQ
jgi:putative DNA-invertase from lambdoid prophage Rac